MFFSFDGVDGVGKSTQMDLFRQWLSEQALDVVFCRDPGSTPVGEQIRKILLGSGPDVPIKRRCEMLLYMAARAQLVDQIIQPALKAGKVIVSDRYLLANVVYQGHAGGLEVDTLWQVGQVATGGLMPDLTFLLDMDHNAATERLDRELDRMEQQGDAFRGRLRQGFLAEARRDPNHIVVIDASQSIEQVHAEVCAAAQRVLVAG